MPPSPRRGTTSDDDTEFVRMTFRAMAQSGVLLTALISTLHSALFALAGSAFWVLHCALALACAGLYWMTAPERRFPVFAVGTLALVASIIGIDVFLTLQFGRAAGFHLLLLALPPAVLVAGRLPMASKILLAMALGACLLAVDQADAQASALQAMPDWFSASVRSINMLVVAATVCALVLRYFQLVTRQHSDMVHLAAHDPLTSLMNRRGLLAAAEPVLASLDRARRPMGVILCDIDHFKAVNDTHGHDAGDEVLRHVGTVLRTSVREADLVARWGGEEFVLLLPEVGREGARQMAERIRARLQAQPLPLEAARIPVTMTLGVARRSPGERLDAVLRRADDRLYAGKRGGRNRVVASEQTGEQSSLQPVWLG